MNYFGVTVLNEKTQETTLVVIQARSKTDAPYEAVSWLFNSRGWNRCRNVGDTIESVLVHDKIEEIAA